MDSSKRPLVSFLEQNFPEVIESWNLTDDEWDRMFAWYVATGNIVQVIQGRELVSFVMFRPMTKDQLGDRGTKFEWEPAGEYLYVPLFVTKKKWKGRGMWNLMKALAPNPYPNIKFIAFESWKDEDQELNIVPVPSRHDGRRSKNGKKVITSRTRTD